MNEYFGYRLEYYSTDEICTYDIVSAYPKTDVSENKDERDDNGCEEFCS